ncbi:hypothetical protein D3C75_1038010 [compost metagenome]
MVRIKAGGRPGPPALQLMNQLFAANRQMDGFTQVDILHNAGNRQIEGQHTAAKLQLIQRLPALPLM